MYLSEAAEQLHETYLAQLRGIQQAAPSTTPYLKKISDEIQAGRYHKALKEAQYLIANETESLSPPTRG